MAITTKKPRPPSAPPAAPAPAPPPEAPPVQSNEPVQFVPPAPVFFGDWLALLFWVGCALLLAVLLLQDLILSLMGF